MFIQTWHCPLTDRHIGQACNLKNLTTGYNFLSGSDIILTNDGMREKLII